VQKRWAVRLRTSGALLILVGAVAAVDRLLPGAERMFATFPLHVQLALAAFALVLGGVLFVLGRRWR
jgi:hypothetical protein